MPTTAQALQPVADRLVDSPSRNGASSSVGGMHRAQHHNNHHHHGGGDGDDCSRLDDIADDDEADFTDTDALLEYLLRDRHASCNLLLFRCKLSLGVVFGSMLLSAPRRTVPFY